MSRLLLTYLIAALIPLFCITGLLFDLKWKAGKQEMQNTVDYAAELLNAQLEAIVNTMSFISLDIVSNEQFVPSAAGLTYSGSSAYEKSMYYSAMVSAISSYSYTSSSYRIVFFNEEGFYLTNDQHNLGYNQTYRLPEGFIDSYEWTKEARVNYGREILLPICDFVLPNVDTMGFSLVRSVRNPGKVVGFLGVQLSGEDLSRLLEAGEVYGIDIMILCDEDVLYQSESFPWKGDTLEDTQALQKELSGKYLVSVRGQESSQIQVVSVVSMEKVFLKNRDEFMLTGTVGITIILLTLILIVIFARMMSRPLVLVTRKMQDTTVRNLKEDMLDINKTSFKEVEILYTEFYKMRLRLEGMIEKEIALRTLQTKERLNYLQSQINPHFLYNTLNIIGIMGAEVGDERIYNSCRMLSEVLKYAVTEKESAFATFEEEFQNTEMYLRLMKLRFEDKISFSAVCDEELKGMKTIRIILQPFVENIFEHGLDAGHTSLSVVIRGHVREDGRWCITIRDNGAGMDEYKLFKLKEEIARSVEKAQTSGELWTDEAAEEGRPAEEGSIGMKNTLVRLSLFYGDAFEYSINNVSSGGFMVSLEGKSLIERLPGQADGSKDEPFG